MDRQLKWILAGILGFLFVSVNLYLIKNDFDMIDRTSIVYDQTTSKEEDLREVLVKDGVIHTANEQHIYFSEQLGMFTRFLVEEGDIVTAGTPLYEYDVLDLEEQRLLFESEAEQIRREITTVQSYITELNGLERELTTVTTTQPTTSATSPQSVIDNLQDILNIELEVGVNISDATVDQTRSLLNQKIGEQEAAVGRLQAQEDKYEALIDGLEESPTVQVESEFNGKIAHLSEGVDNPLITIYSDSLASRSKLTDEEALYIIGGLNARVTSPVAGSTISGSVDSNPKLPDKEPELGEKSLYSIDINLLDPSQDWFVGQQVVNEIITDESIGATTVPITSTNSNIISTLSPQGFIQPRIVDLGLRVEDRQEVYTNLEPGEWIVTDPFQVERNYSAYITPMTINRLTTDNLGGLGQRTGWKYVLLGVLPHQ
ncbi:efflux RND transporter periplasmic adaptor subunit [Jeotgalibacillus proteolyticus]|uniref:YknX-like barrel-sandwich hybrid domain-containing protein n=1 Tax=Jeotgalibacillus proteolyticus TaxID=2082395 RepID=A0A2S5G9A4_9BACL|nr:efflux RND transporter periplasmic adaptor subunit [Jeotgalibacillus proteolyticus]PPA69515.1 hypothetical protein C4B60_13255 [Jeotgalibacillus proteolyticus]